MEDDAVEFYIKHNIKNPQVKKFLLSRHEYKWAYINECDTDFEVINNLCLWSDTPEKRGFWYECFNSCYPFDYLENNLNKINKLLLLNERT